MYSPVFNKIAGRVTPQALRLLEAMERNEFSMTAREAMLDLDITSATLARRICDLEEAGVIITRERRVNPMTGKKYTRYYFDPIFLSEQAAAA